VWRHHEFQEERIAGNTAVEGVLYHRISYCGKLKIFLFCIFIIFFSF
jgi:hypothetical protein